MRPAIRLLLLVAAVPALALVLAAALALQREPLVEPRPVVSSVDVERALRLVRTHDPRRLPPGVPREVSLTQRDLELLLQHGTRRRLDAPLLQIELVPFSARLRASARVPGVPFDLWLNLQARLGETEGLPELDGVKLGRLPLPDWLAAAVAQRLGERFGLRIDPQILRDVVRQVGFTKGVATVAYTWQTDTHLRLMTALVPPADQQRLKAYSDHLASLAGASPAEGGTSLTGLLPAMFDLARQRAAVSGDAAAENRAVLLVLALHASGRGLTALVPSAHDWPRADGLRMTLHGRDDFPQHFLVSAVLAAEGSGPLSDAIGVFKEVMDARHGSGFSFNDIAADRAGTRFGERAVSDPQRMQSALHSGLLEHDLMPDVSDLPEFLAERDFVRRFGGVGGRPYRDMLADIDARINATPLLR